MKRILGLLLALMMLLCPRGAFAAPDGGETAIDKETPVLISAPVDPGDVIVEINGKIINFDVPAQIMNDRTMVPMRKIFETLGVKVEWLAETRQIFSVKGDDAIIFQIDVPRVLIHNFPSGIDTYIDLDQAPVIVNDRTLVPIRAVSESLGANVEWVESERKVVITK